MRLTLCALCVSVVKELLVRLYRLFIYRSFVQELNPNDIAEARDGYKLGFVGKDYARLQAGKKGFKTIDQIARAKIQLAAQKIKTEKGLFLPKNFDGGFKHYRLRPLDAKTLCQNCQQEG